MSIINDNTATAISVLTHVFGALEQTRLIDLPGLAATLGIASIMAKDETTRPLGSFKSLGGTFAAISALARTIGSDPVDLAGTIAKPSGLPRLVCASDGNHGLAVAAGASHMGAPCTVFLHSGVPQARARRIATLGADIRVVDGTYDEAVDAALRFAEDAGHILIPDTSLSPNDPVVQDVMDGYAVISEELKAQIATRGDRRPTHMFVQAGVGGLAAAIATGLNGWLAAPARIVVAEPQEAPCVTLAMAAGRPVRIAGSLETSADMLSCGEASAPALRILRECDAACITVSESELAAAADILEGRFDIATTASAAAGLAALVSAAGDPLRRSSLGITAESRILLIVTERRPPAMDDGA